MFEITHDLIADVANGDVSRVGYKLDVMPLYGIEKVMGIDDEIPTASTKVEFRLRDEDGEVHYQGVLDDDDDCENQSAALRFGESDTGACIIEVKRNGAWVMEIG